GPTSNGAVKVDGAGSTWAFSGSCVGQLIISGASKYESGGTALFSVTNGGTVVFESNPSESEAVWVGPSGTLTGNGTITATSPFRPTTFLKGTIAPTSQLFIDMNFRLDYEHGTM